MRTRPTFTEERAEQLYLRALAIREDHARGFWAPILRHLAMRRHSEAMIDLASWYSDSTRLADLGTTIDAFSAAGLYHRAYRMGNARAAQHLAMNCSIVVICKGIVIGFGRGPKRGIMSLDANCASSKPDWHTALLVRSDD